MSTIESKWECGDCHELHDYEDDAHECCRPVVREVFICPQCDDVHSSHSDAVDCCEPDPDELDPPRRGPTPLELEAMGQTRLF